jgi:tetratricopeptide (TPR) repeat protein
MFDIAKQTGKSLYHLEANHAGWSTAVWQGTTPVAEEFIKQGLRHYNKDQHQQDCISLTGHDSGICGWTFSAINSWLAGYPDQALRHAKEANERATDLNHAFSRTYGLFAHSIIGYFYRDVDELARWTETLRNHSYKNQQKFFMVLVTMLQAWECARKGSYLDAKGQMTEAFEIMHQAKIYGPRPLLISSSMDMYLMANQPDEGIRIFQKELEEFPISGERFMESEIRRLYGELLLVKGVQQQAEQEFQLALNIARNQDAKSLELRAGMSLARLWGARNKQREAYQMLSNIYNWFTEGFDTLDFKDGRALLEELS